MFKTHLFIALCVIFFTTTHPLSISAQNYARIDSLAINTPGFASQTMADLSAYCEANAYSEAEKVRFYFVWIARNIQYDDRTYAFYRQNADYDVARQSVSVVFTQHKAVCRGYALMLERLCKQSNIAVRYVAGYGKSTLTNDHIEPHAWNIIRIDGQWSLYDVTWASNSLQDDSTDLTPQFEKWFKSAPDYFAQQHWSYDPIFQLTKDLTSRNDFLGYTEGAPTPQLNFDIEATLNAENVLDSLEATWRSYSRAHLFSPMDSLVAQKLARAQDEKAKAAIEPAESFFKNEYPRRSELTVQELENWRSRLENLRNPIAESLLLHIEIDDLPITAKDLAIVQKNRRRLVALSQFVPVMIQALQTEIHAR